jgi:GcrA cell cycle regulator
MNPAANSATWTTERVQQLQKCVTAGLTCSEIAAEIGVTRNAVIGKISRLGLSLGRARGAIPGRMRAARTRPPARLSPMARILRAVVAAEPAESAAATEAPPVESARRCSLLDLAGSGCRWPLGEPGTADFGFCGNDAITGFSYCAGHMRMAYRVPYGRCA